MNIKLACLSPLLILVLLNTHLSAQTFQKGDTYDLEFIPLLDGEKHYLTDVEDKIRVFNFWFIGCQGCVLELDYLNQLRDEYMSDEVAFLSITGNRGKDLDNFLIDHPIQWEIIGNVAMVERFTDYPTFNPRCYPTTMIVDRNDSVVYAKCYPLTNEKDSQEFREAIEAALALRQ
ncbi:MAG: TlpA disulfide reductase family protein [Cyclobacteriaceae bacterium]